MRPPLALPSIAVICTLASIVGIAWTSAASAEGHAPSLLDLCLAQQNLTRIARVLDPSGRVVFARVTQEEGGHITRAVAIAPGDTPSPRFLKRRLREICLTISQ